MVGTSASSTCWRLTLAAKTGVTGGPESMAARIGITWMCESASMAEGLGHSGGILAEVAGQDTTDDGGAVMITTGQGTTNDRVLNIGAGHGGTNTGGIVATTVVFSTDSPTGTIAIM